MNLRNCPLCGQTKPQVLIELPAHRFCVTNLTYRRDFGQVLGIRDDQPFPIVQCMACGFVYAGILPDRRFLEVVYESVIDAKRAEAEALKPQWVSHQLRLAALLLDELSDVFAHEENLAILDYGCGYGTLVRALSNTRTRCVGFETNQQQVNCLRRAGVMGCSDIDELQSRGPFHGIILSDVLEHVPNPAEVLKLCRGLLLRSGILCVSVPDFGTRIIRQMLSSAARGGSLCRGVNPWEHLNYFSADSLERLLCIAGFSVRCPSGPVDIGLRLGFRGLRRLRNAGGAGLRLTGYVLGLPSRTTTLVAQKSHKQARAQTMAVEGGEG